MAKRTHLAGWMTASLLFAGSWCSVRGATGSAAPVPACTGDRRAGAGVWVEHENWAVEWEKTAGHDLRRSSGRPAAARGGGRRPSPAPEDGELVVPGKLFRAPVDDIREARDNARLFVLAGRYCWGTEGVETACVAARLHLRGITLHQAVVAALGSCVALLTSWHRRERGCHSLGAVVASAAVERLCAGRNAGARLSCSEPLDERSVSVPARVFQRECCRSLGRRQRLMA